MPTDARCGCWLSHVPAACCLLPDGKGGVTWGLTSLSPLLGADTSGHLSPFRSPLWETLANRCGQTARAGRPPGVQQRPVPLSGFLPGARLTSQSPSHLGLSFRRFKTLNVGTSLRTRCRDRTHSGVCCRRAVRAAGFGGNGIKHSHPRGGQIAFPGRPSGSGPVRGHTTEGHCTAGRAQRVHGQLTSFLLISYNVYRLTPAISKPLKLRGLASRFGRGVLPFQQRRLSPSEEIKGLKEMVSLSGTLCHPG